ARGGLEHVPEPALRLWGNGMDDPSRVVRGTIVHDDDLMGDIRPLGKETIQRDTQRRPPIAGRDDDREHRCLPTARWKSSRGHHDSPWDVIMPPPRRPTLLHSDRWAGQEGSGFSRS